MAALDAWTQRRGQQRPHPHPRTGKPADFLFAEHGRRLSAWRIREGLRTAAGAAGLAGPGGQPLNVTPHQLRHTYATELANAGMSLQALMAVLGHVTPEMTLRYATLASPALRSAYDQAIGRVRKTLPIAPVGQPIVPAKVDWIASEFLKTRVAHGYCSRHLAAGACPYANICEPATTSFPAPSTCPSCMTSFPTSAGYAPMLNSGAGTAKSSGTAVSSARSSTIAAASKTRPSSPILLDKITMAG